MGVIADIHKDLDRGALQLLVEYRGRLQSEAIKLCGDNAHAEDLVFRTIERVLDRADTYKEDINLFAWMKSIMENIHKDDLKRPVPRGTMAIESGELEKCAGADWSTDEQILRNSDEEVVREALRHIDPEFKQLVLMRYYDEFSLKEIAGILNKPIGTIGRRIQIVHRLLAGKLAAKLGRKPVAVLLAALLGIGTLWGAWVSPLGDWVAEKVFGSAPAETAHLDEAHFIIDPISGTGKGPAEEDNPVTLPQTNDNVISETPKQESETNMNISAQIKKTVAAAAVAAMGFAARADLPPSYVQCEYIESTGWEYIKTGILPSRSTRFVLDYQMLQATAPRDLRGKVDYPAMGGNVEGCQFDIGAQPSGENGCVARARCHDNWGDYVVYEDVNAFERTVVELRGDGSVWANGLQRTTQTALKSSAYTDFSKTGGLYLFGVAQPGDLATYPVLFPCAARVFGCQFYEGETLVRDFVPCFDLVSGTYGLYDAVGQKFYGNASGEGAFHGNANIDFEYEARALKNGDWKMFKYESRLTFKKMQPGKTLSNVPVLVRISESAIDGFKYEDCVGGCLAFASSPNGEWLDYEIEKWDAKGESLVWIRIPELTQKTRIKMYWGAKDGHCLVPVVSSASVWGKSGYSTVLHMNALDGTDATGGNEFTSKGTDEGVGPVGECLLKTSTSDGVNVSRAGNKAPWAKALMSQSFTMSFWVYFTTGGSTYPYMAQWGTSNLLDADGFWLGASQDPKVGSYGTAFWFTAHSQIGAVFKTLKPELDWETLNYNNQWVHYTYSYEQLEDGRAHVRVFLNGTLVNEVTQALPDGATSYITAASNDLRLMGCYMIFATSDKIRMDEFRLSPVARDADYVSAAYRTMAESGFITMSAAKAATSPAQGLVVFFF